MCVFALRKGDRRVPGLILFFSLPPVIIYMVSTSLTASVEWIDMILRSDGFCPQRKWLLRPSVWVFRPKRPIPIISNVVPLLMYSNTLLIPLRRRMCSIKLQLRLSTMLTNTMLTNVVAS